MVTQIADNVMIVENSRTLSVQERLAISMRTKIKRCRYCKTEVVGRTDKIFCTVYCKNTYHKKLKRHTSNAARSIDKILHRNRSILQELLGKKISYLETSRDVLDSKRFNFDYVTGYHLNSRNKIVNYVYDFSWIIWK